MRPAEMVRISFALAGLALWVGFPFVFWNGGIAVFQYRCHRMPIIEGRDPCFTDYLPFLEITAFAMAILLFYPFLKLAMALFAPDPPHRSRLWIGAPRSARADRRPVTLLFCALGFVWLLLNARSYPWALHAYWCYWGAWVAWVCAGVVFSLAPTRTDPTA